MATRAASHAGAWYSDNGATLSKQLDGWLNQVDDTIEGVGKIPLPGARVIITPYWSSVNHSCCFADIGSHRHAGYTYSGPAAAWAYKSLDLSKA